MSLKLDLLIAEEIEANKRVEEAKRKAREIVAEAREKAEKILDKGVIEQRIEEYLKAQEEKIKEEAEKMKTNLLKRAEIISKIGDDKIREAADFLIEEVLKFE